MSEVLITLEGFPEKVQRIADAIEDAFPNAIVWVCSPNSDGVISIKIEGREVPVMHWDTTR